MLDKRIRWFMGKALLEQKQEIIRKAIEEQKSISFQYIKGDGSVTLRTINPEVMEEMVHKHTPYPGVSGICHLRNAKRVFHVGRMFELILNEK